MRKPLTALAFLLIAAALAAGAYWKLRLRPGLLVEETRYGSLQWLADGVIEFKARRGRLPKSLEEIVRAGALPENHRLYGNAMKRGELSGPEIAWDKSEFEIQFGTDAVKISIPEAVFNDPRYSAVRGSWRTWTVTLEDSFSEMTTSAGGKLK